MAKYETLVTSLNWFRRQKLLQRLFYEGTHVQKVASLNPGTVNCMDFLKNNISSGPKSWL